MTKYSSSVVATGCIAGARNLLGVIPVWSEHMKTITGKNYDQIEECYNTILALYLKTNSKKEKENDNKKEISNNKGIEHNETIKKLLNQNNAMVFNCEYNIKHVVYSKCTVKLIKHSKTLSEPLASKYNTIEMCIVPMTEYEPRKANINMTGNAVAIFSKNLI